MQSVDVFEAERPRLLGLAYRILGSAVDAEDVVQEAWVRWQAAHDVERPAAWLTTVVSRLALDSWRAQQRKREDYVGPWLPEPVATEPDPADRAEMADSLTFGFLVLLDELSAVERVVFLLADVFGEPFADIAATVGKSEAACRQIASRARRKLQESKPHRSLSASPSLADRAAVGRVSGRCRGDDGAPRSRGRADERRRTTSPRGAPAGDRRRPRHPPAREHHSQGPRPRRRDALHRGESHAVARHLLAGTASDPGRHRRGRRPRAGDPHRGEPREARPPRRAR